MTNKKYDRNIMVATLAPLVEMPKEKRRAILADKAAGLFNAGKYSNDCSVELHEYARSAEADPNLLRYINGEDNNYAREMSDLVADQFEQVAALLDAIRSNPVAPPAHRSVAAAMLQVAEQSSPGHIISSIEADAYAVELIGEVERLCDEFRAQEDEDNHVCSCAMCGIRALLCDAAPEELHEEIKSTCMEVQMEIIREQSMNNMPAGLRDLLQALTGSGMSEADATSNPEFVRKLTEELADQLPVDEDGNPFDVVSVVRVDNKTGKKEVFDPKTGEKIDASAQDVLEAAVRRKNGRLS